MKTFLLLSVLASALTFGQSKDFTKKQAFEAFKKSNVRIALGYKTADFNRIYNSNDFPISNESLILNSLNKKELKELVEYEKCADNILKNSQTHRYLSIPINTPKSKFKEYMSVDCKPTN